jgi:hypothetical protein
MRVNIRLIYLYLFSAVGLITVVFGSVRLLDLGLKVIVFRGADRYEYYAPKPEGIDVDENEQKIIQERETKRQRERDLSGSIAMIAVGLPLYYYHWKTIKKENKTKRNG